MQAIIRGGQLHAQTNRACDCDDVGKLRTKTNILDVDQYLPEPRGSKRGD